MISREEFETIADFCWVKNKALYSQQVPKKEMLDEMIKVAEDLQLLASKAQLIRYRDHYYPKEEK